MVASTGGSRAAPSPPDASLGGTGRHASLDSVSRSAAGCLASMRQPAELIKEAVVANTRQIAGQVGSTLAATLVSEFPRVQPHLYDSPIPPVVCLSGVLVFVAGPASMSA